MKHRPSPKLAGTLIVLCFSSMTEAPGAAAATAVTIATTTTTSTAATTSAIAATEPQKPSVPEPEGYWNGPINGAVPRTIRGGEVIDVETAGALLKGGRAVFIDVSNAPRRPEKLAPEAPWLPPPHPSIPGAYWIAGVGLGALPTPVERFFRERLAILTDNNLAHPLVMYCHQRCWLSWNGAKRAIGYGYRRVYWFPDGIEGWRAAHQPIETVKPEEAPATDETPTSDGASAPAKIPTPGKAPTPERIPPQ